MSRFSFLSGLFLSSLLLALVLPPNHSYISLGRFTQVASPYSFSNTSTELKQPLFPVKNNETVQTLPATVKTAEKTDGEKMRGKELRNLTEQLLQLNERLSKNKNDPTRRQLVFLMKRIAEERKQQFLFLLNQDPLLVWSNIIRRSESPIFPPEVKNLLEQPVVLDGVVEEIVHFDGGNLYFRFTLNSNGKKYQIYPVLETPPLSSGAVVRVEGYQIENKIIVAITNKNFQIINAAPPTTSFSETLGEQKTAVILVRFSDSSTFPFTVQQINDSVFNGPVQQFLRENSFNQMWLAGKTYGWYTLNDTCAGEGDRRAGWVRAGEAIALADPDIFFPDIDRLIIISDAFCNSAPNGLGTIGKTDLNSNDGLFRASYTNIRNSVFFYEATLLPSGGQRDDKFTSGLGLILHEFGHNLGAWHANNLDCGTEIVYGGCSYGNYGNFYDVMGRGWITGTPLGYGGTNFETNPNATFHFNALLKKEFQWIRGRSFLEITQNGTYTLKPLEQPQAIIAAIKQTSYPQITPYYLEYRIPFGYDKSLNDSLSRGNRGGIFINKQDEQGGELLPQTQLLDMSPTTYDNFDEDWYQVSLLPGQVFFNEIDGIKITNLKEDTSNPNDPKVIFSVEFYQPTCRRFNPNLEIIEIRRVEGRPGQELDLTDYVFVYVLNKDSFICSNSTFKFEVDAPEGWRNIFEPSKVIIPPGRNGGSPDIFKVSIPPGASAGYYPVSLTVTNLNSGREDTETFRVLVTP